jgi:hypothetical protein
MRRRHGLLGNITDKLSRHQELKHSQRLSDNLARGNIIGADYHAAKARKWSNINSQLNVRGSSVVYSGVAPILQTYPTTNTTQPIPRSISYYCTTPVQKIYTSSTLVSPISRSIPFSGVSPIQRTYSRSAMAIPASPSMQVSTINQRSMAIKPPGSLQIQPSIHADGFYHESQNVTSKANINYYRSESKKISSPSGYHLEAHKAINQGRTQTPSTPPLQPAHQSQTNNLIISSRITPSHTVNQQRSHQSQTLFDSQADAGIATRAPLSSAMPRRGDRYDNKITEKTYQKSTNPFLTSYGTSEKVIQNNEAQRAISRSPDLLSSNRYAENDNKDTYHPKTTEMNKFDGFDIDAKKLSHHEESRSEHAGRH